MGINMMCWVIRCRLRGSWRVLSSAAFVLPNTAQVLGSSLTPVPIVQGQLFCEDMPHADWSEYQ